jgi:hypothetical protein
MTDMDSIDPNNIRKYLRELRNSGTYETVFKDAITAGEFAHWYQLYKVIQEQKSTGPAQPASQTIGSGQMDKIGGGDRDGDSNGDNKKNR